MFPLLRAKIGRAWSQLRVEGAAGVARRMLRDWSLGRKVESNGNRVRLAGLTISVGNRAISTRSKSMLISGKYERSELGLIERFLPAADPVIELGGSIGVVACFTNRRLTQPVRHVVVEANPDLIVSLQENARLNDCQFEVINAAVAYDTDAVTFYGGSTFLAGSVRPTEGRRYVVPAVSLAGLLSRIGTKSVSLVSDIEGSEVDLVDREIELLKSRVRWFFVETHPDSTGLASVARMRETLASAGFVERACEDDVFAFENVTMDGGS